MMTVTPIQSQASPWSEALNDAENRGVTWIRVTTSNGELVNWSTALAGLVILGQGDIHPSTRPLGFQGLTESDQVLVTSMVKYVIDGVISANPPITDVRAGAYAVTLLNQFRLTGGPSDVGANQSVDEAMSNALTGLLQLQELSADAPPCQRGGWSQSGGNTTEMWHTQAVASALVAALRNPNIGNRMQIEESLEAVGNLIGSTQLENGAWPSRPCASAAPDLTTTAAILYINEMVNGTAASLSQRRALNYLSSALQLTPQSPDQERFYELLWSVNRLRQTLAPDLIVPPFFTKTPERDPIADGYPSQSASLEYDLHRILMDRQSLDGTFACTAEVGLSCERPIHATLFGLMALEQNLMGGCIDAHTDADGICADLDTCGGTHDPLQTDSDGDHVGDLCDVCVDEVDPEQGDEDGDGIGDFCDPLNCVPLEFELCNGLDDDCDAGIDEEIPFTGEACAADSGGACAVGERFCVDGIDVCIPNRTPVREQCDGLDNDCDNSVDENSATWLESCITGQPGECSLGFTACQNGRIECRPLTPATEERCDGLDNDCDGIADEGNPGGQQACATGDQGLCSQGRTQCLRGQTICIRDQDAAGELCDGLDNDCDGIADEGAPQSGETCTIESQVGACATGVTACQNSLVVCLPLLSPNERLEVCNGIDDDCDGEVDDNVVSPDPVNIPNVGDACETQCGSGVVECALGALRCNGPEVGFDEFCDGEDNDCDGVVDENVPGLPGVGVDCLTGDSGACAGGLTACANGAITCEPTNSVESRAGEQELCNDFDDDCDGTVDEDAVGGGLSCTTPLLGVCAVGNNRCINGSLACVSAQQPSEERCDGLDNNCNGFVDENIQSVGTECPTGRDGVCALGVINCQNVAGGDEFGLVCVPNIEATAETCDALDNDCDGITDENAVPPNTLCETGDLGACRLGALRCVGGETSCRQVTLPDTEICDGSDNDCDGAVDESDLRLGLNCTSDLQGACAAGIFRCIGGGILCQSSERPTAERCDGVDNDCDGFTDEGNPESGAVCPLFNQIGQCSVGRTNCVGGQLTCSVLQEPEDERCDGQDNDCDAAIDEGDPDSGAPCSTGRFGQCDEGRQTCSNGGLICESLRAPMDELCDGLDNDCDGVVDEETNSMNLPCDTGEKGLCREGVQVCTIGLFACDAVTMPAGESCNALDDDCDGRIDEGLLNACGRCGLAPSETCDGVDNDCDGNLDEGQLCASERVCALGTCASACIANECPDPNDTCVDGGCVPRCLAAQCEEGWPCSNGVCMDPCTDIVCGEGEVCFRGQCVGDSCYQTGCPAGERCEQGNCVMDRCSERDCETGTFCRQLGDVSECVGTCASIACGFEQICVDGACVADSCANVECPSNVTCMDGVCDSDCGGIICPEGQRCRRGQCQHDPCFNTECPGGQRCEERENRAQCVPGWLDQPEEPMSRLDAGLPDPMDMNTPMSADANFVPTTYDQGSLPPQFELDVGTEAQMTSSSDGCDCTQQHNTPLNLWLFALVLPLAFLRRVS